MVILTPFVTNNETELWNGSSWTEVADLNATKELAGYDNTSALAVWWISYPANTTEMKRGMEQMD